MNVRNVLSRYDLTYETGESVPLYRYANGTKFETIIETWQSYYCLAAHSIETEIEIETNFYPENYSLDRKLP